MTISEMTVQMASERRKSSFSDYTIWSEIAPIISFYERHGKENFDRGLTDEYIRLLRDRADRGEICVGHYRKMKRGADKLSEFHDTSKLEYSCPRKESKIYVLLLSTYAKQ